MKLHYYGMLDSLESCYTFQEFEVDGMKLYIQNSPRFGYEPATMIIKNPALFVRTKAGYLRYDIEDFSIAVSNGMADVNDDTICEIIGKIKESTTISIER